MVFGLNLTCIKIIKTISSHRERGSLRVIMILKKHNLMQLICLCVVFTAAPCLAAEDVSQTLQKENTARMWGHDKASGVPYELKEDNPTAGHMTTMSETVSAVIKNHKALKSIQENRVVAEEELARSKAGYGPRIDLTGNSGLSNVSNSTTRSYGNQSLMYGVGTVRLLLTQPIWNGLATRSRVRSSQSILDSVTSRVIDNATTLALDGIIAHVDLIWRRKTLELSQVNVVTHERILALTRDREATGADTIANVTQTQGRLIRAQTTLESARADLVQGEDSYARLTEMPVPVALGPVKQPLKMFSGPHEVIAYAKKNNPKIIAYLADVRTEQAAKELAEAAYHPTINLEAGPNYSNYGYNYYQDTEGWTTGVDVLGTVTWNLFNSGADFYANKAQSARIREARQTANNFLDDLNLQINNSWTDYQTAVIQLAQHEEAIGYNLQTRDLYMEQFLIGQRTLLDVLDAESELYNSEIQAVTARANILISSYTLYALAGLLLPELQITADQVLIAPAKTNED